MAVRAEENPEPSSLRIVMEMLQLAFDIEELAIECTWDNVILIPTGGGDYYSIGLVKVIWKVIFIIINRCLAD